MLWSGPSRRRQGLHSVATHQLARTAGGRVSCLAAVALPCRDHGGESVALPPSRASRSAGRAIERCDDAGAVTVRAPPRAWALRPQERAAGFSCVLWCARGAVARHRGGGTPATMCRKQTTMIYTTNTRRHAVTTSSPCSSRAVRRPADRRTRRARSHRAPRSGGTPPRPRRRALAGYTPRRLPRRTWGCAHC